jgi:ADP-ribosylglycohydrolase
MDRALGCLLGVAVGDAAGATLEGRGAQLVPPAAARAALRMPGSAMPYLGRGQVTDDTELTICLARGLAGHGPIGGFPLESVARQYSFWHDAGAFGGGQTCQIAFSTPLEPDRAKWLQPEGPGSAAAPSLAARMQARSLRWCSESKANGALMRAAPLAVWGHRLPPATLAECAALDASLSHPNPTCGEASAAYVIALARLIARPGDAAGALAAACDWARDCAGGEVQEWLLTDSQQPLESIPCLESAGFVKHAFTLAFHHLRRQTPFVDGIEQTICRGGDTDTNAAIVGGMLGALWGAGAIPDWMTGPVLAYEGREDQGGGVPRPAELRAAVLPGLAQLLYQAATADG